MNNKSLVKLSNVIGIISIVLLVYWVFVFICITVFGFRVFRENLTETFYLSVVGILALMFGALIVNVMFNLTRIAEKHNQDQDNLPNATSKKAGIIFMVSLPIVFVLLLGGDYLTSQKREKMLISSATSIIESNQEKSKHLINYTFEKKWINRTEEILGFYEKTDKNSSNVSLIVLDTLDQSKVYLGFNDYSDKENDSIPPRKRDFIHETTQEERAYLDDVFFKNFTGIRFSARNGSYELFYPYVRNGKKVVLYFSDFQRYGKIGS